MDSGTALFFAPEESRQLGDKIAAGFGLALSALEDRRFADGEHKLRPLEPVQSCNVYAVQSLYSDDNLSVNDKLCRLLFLASTLKDASARSITAIIPYLCYARKDRRTNSQDPVTNRYVAQLLETAGIDRIVTMAVHNLQAYENAFRRPALHVQPDELFAAYFAEKADIGELAIVSPDTGGIKRAREFAETLEKSTGREVKVSFLEKKRHGGIISGSEAIRGELKGRTAIIFDDIIASGETMARAAKAAQAAGAAHVFAAAAHGLFVGNANEVFSNPVFDGVIITDTVSPFRLQSEAERRKLIVLNSAPLFVQAIGQPGTPQTNSMSNTGSSRQSGG